MAREFVCNHQGVARFGYSWPAEASLEVYVINTGEAGRSGPGSSPKRDSIYGCIVNLIVII